MHQAFLYISYRHCTTTTWTCPISRFVEDVNTRQRLSSSLPELRYSLLEFISRKQLTTFDELDETRSKRDKVWGSVTSLFKWRFRSRGCRCSLSSLTIKKETASKQVISKPASASFLKAEFRCINSTSSMNIQNTLSDPVQLKIWPMLSWKKVSLRRLKKLSFSGE